MHKTPTKRRELAQRTFMYAIMTTFVIAVVAVLVFVMLGYRFNQTSKNIVQGGLVQFSSHPADARIKVGRANIANTTPSKITVNPGNYPVTMNRDGYQQWKKDVTVKSGEILWLNYAQLVPNILDTQAVQSIPQLAQTLASPNGKYIALLADNSKASFSTLEINGSSVKQLPLTLPGGLLTNAAQSQFTMLRWSSDSSKLLAKRTVKKQTEWFVIDRADPSKSYNITTKYTVDLNDAMFDPRSHDRLFIRTTTGDIQLLDSSQPALSAPVVHSAVSMSLLDSSAMMFVQKSNTKENSIGYFTLGASHGRELTRVVATKPALVAAGIYFSDVHVAVAVGNELSIYKLDGLPSSDSNSAVAMTVVSTVPLPSSPLYLLVRAGGRFVIAQSNRGFATYDLELDKSVVTDVATMLSHELNWLDRYHPYYSLKNQLQVLEFDGANRHAIATVAADFDTVQTDDGKYIYSFGAAKTGYQLQRTQMILN